MNRTEVRSIARVAWPYVALWCLVAAGLVGFARYEIDRNRERALNAGRAEADNLARVMSEHVGQVLQGFDRTLALFKFAHETQLAPHALARLGDAMKPIHGTDAERRVNKFDAEGRFVDSTDPELVSASISIADRVYFRQARERRDLPLFVGEPLAGRVSGTVIVPVAKRLETRDGTFDGVVAIGLDPQRLVHLFRALRVGESSAIGIAHRDGTVVAYAKAGTADDHDAPRTIAQMVRQEDLISLSVVQGTDLIAFAALPSAQLLAAHERFAASTLGFAVITLCALTLPIMLVGARTWNEVHRRRLLEMRYASAELQARTDPLTGLANRKAFDDARRVAHERLVAEREPFALAFVDVDHFKRLNDTLGHEAGDDALRRIAETLQSAIRHSDMVGRLGGDEFAVLMPGVTAETMHRRFDPIKLDLDAMVKRFAWPISFSIGVVACETPTPRPRDAVNFADRVMYDAKAGGRDAIRYAVYRDGRLALEQEGVANAA
ncbi:MAG TPA: diguanylate cyclase [Casimicrobiaceae bacterium]|nr:diguanylate cyclase [Casimicrobiaceae bacterium]